MNEIEILWASVGFAIISIWVMGGITYIAFGKEVSEAWRWPIPIASFVFFIVGLSISVVIWFQWNSLFLFGGAFVTGLLWRFYKERN